RSVRRHLMVVVAIAAVGLAREGMLCRQPVSKFETPGLVRDRRDWLSIRTARVVAVEMDDVRIRRAGRVAGEGKRGDEGSLANPAVLVDVGNLPHHEIAANELDEISLLAQL